MTINKTEMQSELREFVERFASSVSRIYGGVPHSNPLGDADSKPEDTMLWRTVNSMFDFGVRGVAAQNVDVGDGKMLDADFADVEMFLRGLGSLAEYLDEDECRIPELAVRAVRMAIARHVLEGGDRLSWFDDGGDANLLSFEEMALLANMDERSVRNAANPKVTDPLATVVMGKRTYIEPQEAKRWLVSRKGFVPTQALAAAEETAPSEHKVTVELEQVTLQRLQTAALAEGISVDALLAKLIP